MDLLKSELLNVDTAMLKKYFDISSSVKKTDVINFTIKDNAIIGIANNEADSIYKSWSLPITTLCESVNNLPTVLKCSIYKGEEFSKKILGYFGQTVNINLFHVDGGVKSIELFKLDEKNRVSMKITIVAASIHTAFVEYSDDLIAGIFNPGDEGKLVSFKLSNSELSIVNKLSKLTANPEIQTDYIHLYTEEGSLKATDKGFDVILHETDVIIETPIEIEKSLWSMIDKDVYDAAVYEIGSNKFLLCKSETQNVTITLVLLSNIDEAVDFDDFK